MKQSNVVALIQPTELHRLPLLLSGASGGFQRAVVVWADVAGQQAEGSVLRVLERAALVTEHCVLYEREGPVDHCRFVGNRISALHRTLAESVVRGPAPLKPVGHRHVFAIASGPARELRSLVLPFGDYLVVMLED